MSSYAENYHAVVMGAHNPEQAATTATFVWAEGNSGTTYNIALDQSLSLEFDGSFPVRITSITARDAGLSRSLETIAKLTTPELSERFRTAQKVGQFILDIHVSLENRLLLARIQLESDLTSPELKLACETFIESNRLSKENSDSEIA